MITFGSASIRVAETRHIGSWEELTSRTVLSHEELEHLAVTNLYVEHSQLHLGFTVSCFALACSLTQALYGLPTLDSVSIDFGEGLKIEARLGIDQWRMSMFAECPEKVIDSWVFGPGEFVLFVSLMLADLARSAASAQVDMGQLIRWGPPIIQ